MLYNESECSWKLIVIIAHPFQQFIDLDPNNQENEQSGISKKIYHLYYRKKWEFIWC